MIHTPAARRAGEKLPLRCKIKQPLPCRLLPLVLVFASVMLWPVRSIALVPLPQRHSSSARPPREPANSGDPRRVRFTIAPYLQDVRTDGIVVAWETEKPASGVVRVDLPGRRTAFLSPPGTHHEVRLSGLRPGTRYRYVVAVRAAAEDEPDDASKPASPPPPETRSEPAEFSTAPTSGNFTFLVYGDNRDRDVDHGQVIRAMVPEVPDFVLQTGDMTGNAGVESLWTRYFAVAAPLLRAAPMYPVLGNHELHGDPEARHFYRFFVLPGGRNTQNKAVYYSFRYGNSLFVALDGNSPYDSLQGPWLERTLAIGSADATLRHIFVFVHQPPFAVGAYCGSEREQKRFVPLFQRYKVRAVFGGHEHAYQHLERGGIRYFVSGGGGAPLYHRTQPCTEEDQRALKLFRAEHHYLRVKISGDEALLTAISKSGEIMEQVALHQPVPTRTQDVLSKAQRSPEISALGEAALALPLAVMVGMAVATVAFVLVRPLVLRGRRREKPRRRAKGGPRPRPR